MNTPPPSSLGRVVRTVAGIAVLAATLAGCASTTPSTSPGAPAGGGATSTPTNAPTTPGLTVRYTSPLTVAVSADGKTLSTPIDWAGCSEEPKLIAVSQDTTKVVVEIKNVSYARPGVMCPNIARTGTATLVLNAPLDSRPLIDGTTSAPIARG